MLTDNDVLLSRHQELPVLMCAQRKATKKVPTVDDLIKSNIASFGDDIGRTTNWITSMFEVQSSFEPGSVEYETLKYRICCGQLYQQNCIDKAKGVLCKPMPPSWHDHHAANKVDEGKRELYHDIVADRKPYFMKYIYPALSKDYSTYVGNSNKNCVREFGITLDELLATEDRTPRQEEFLSYYRLYMPVGDGDCVMNRICRRFEEAFDHTLSKPFAQKPFDYTIMKGGYEYTDYQKRTVNELYQSYTNKVKSFFLYQKFERVDEDEASLRKQEMLDEFLQRCAVVCPSKRVLCDILLDICYSKSSTKKFVWEVCADEIVENLLARHDGWISLPVRDANGNVLYNGERYKMTKVQMEDYKVQTEENDDNNP